MSDFLSKLAVAWPPETWRDVTLLVAVSGGADSVALLRGLLLLKKGTGGPGEGRIVAAHFNHRLRGAESDADEEFVRQLAQELDLPFEVGSCESGLNLTGDGLEAAARAARYAFLTDAAHRFGARYVVTAHTSDDQVETVLHRILRGTGISGLAGIPLVRELSPAVSVVRPLLGVARAEVIAFLDSLGQSYSEDSSNVLAAFTRNRIRHELLPHLERDLAPDIRAALLRLARLAEENQDYLDSQLEPLLSQRVTRRGESIVIDCAGLAPIHRHLLRELLIRIWSLERWPQQDMTLEKWDQLAALAQSTAAPRKGQPEVQSLPGPIRAEKRVSELWLTR